MEIPCPACGKANDIRTVEACSRCACDLGSLARIVFGAIWHLKAAACAARAREWEAALVHAEKSWSLRHSVRAARAAYLAATALRENRQALRWRLRSLGDED